MKGLLLRLFELVVVDEHGEEAWQRIFELAGVSGGYQAAADYPDEDFRRLVKAASSRLGKPPREVLRGFGRAAFPHLAKGYRRFVAPHEHTRGFLLTLNEIIHPEVKRAYPGAETPLFDYDASDPQVLRMDYASKRELCALAEGLIEAAAAHYRENLTMTQPVCMLRGDPRCRFEMSFEKAASPAPLKSVTSPERDDPEADPFAQAP